MKKLTWKQIKKNCEKGIPMKLSEIPKKHLSDKPMLYGVLKLLPDVELKIDRDCPQGILYLINSKHMKLINDPSKGAGE